MLTLLVRQRPKSGFEAAEPFVVVVDARDVVAGVDQPVHEHVQRDTVVVRVHHVEGAIVRNLAAVAICAPSVVTDSATKSAGSPS